MNQLPRLDRLPRLAGELIGFALCVTVIYAAPDIALTLIVIILPIIAVLTGLSVLYLRNVYLRQPTPRSRFFGMLVGISTRTWIGTMWVGYLTLGRIGDRTDWFDLPVPGPNVSAPISGLVVAYLMTPPIFYAANVYRVRKRAPGRTAEITELTLDRKDEEVV